MKLTPIKVIRMTVLFIVFTILFSCSKDSDLFLDAVLNEPEVSIEEKNGAGDEPTLVEEGFEVRTFSFSPTNDAYLQDTQGHDQSIIRLQEDFRTSYLMFDLSQIDGPITEAVLQFSIDSDEGDGSISIHRGLLTNWTEENLSIENAPGQDLQLGAMNKSYKVGTPEKVVLDATNLSAENTTLVLTHREGNDLAFASKEHPTSIGPQLIVTYQAPKNTPLIEQQEEEPTQEQTTEENTTPEETNSPNNNTASTEGAYYVTVNGKASNDGSSEAKSWNIAHAFDRAVAGDVVYVKAGDYGNKELIADNSGYSGKTIQFIGYTNTPGDIESSEGSTFKYGDAIDANKMPLIKGQSNSDGIGLNVPENYVQISNMFITNFEVGIVSQGSNVKLKNIVVTEIGIQSNNSKQNGKGIHIYGNKTILEDSFVLNANSEGVTIKGAEDCTIKHTYVYSDNAKNPTGYYILIGSNGNNNIVENCIAYRDPNATIHQGHGILVKDKGTRNIIRGCKTYNTGYEVNFSGVTDNIFEDCFIYGRFSEYSNQFSTRIAVINGAHNNTFKNFYIEDARYAIKFRDFDDGYEASDADRDEEEGGHNNKFINITVNKAQNIAIGESHDVGAAAFSENNTFVDCNFKNIKSVPFYSYQTIKDTQFINCNFEDIPNSEIVKLYDGGSFQMSFQSCTFENIGFTEPD